jgi:rhodanese-related sulfurtransferase
MIGKLRRALFGQRNALGAVDAKHALDSGSVLVDVRGSGEWHAGHAPQAIHIPLEQLTRRLAELPADRHIVTVCRSGHRSAVASGLLRGAGRNASNLTGGMNSWADAGLPVVTDLGTPGHVA